MYKFIFNLKAFDGEGTAAGAGADGTGAISQAAAVTGAQSQGTTTKADATPNKTEPTFEQYMKDHKDEATKWFDNRFNKRHADYNRLQESVKASKGIMEMLAMRFGIEDSGDIASITQALENDDFLYAQRAEENGRSIEEQRNWDRMQRENKAYREQQAYEEQQRNAQRQFQAWTEQFNNLKQIFPNVDVEAELTNPEFATMLKQGYSVQRAFYAIHGEEIAAGAMKDTANLVRKATAEDIAARGGRPRENGLSSQAAVKLEKDMAQLTKAERAQLAKQSMLRSIRI